MPNEARIRAQIENAASALSPSWPLRSFVATNPLSGFESLPLESALEAGLGLFHPDESPKSRVDAVLLKYLSAFLDEGQASWKMPDRHRGFYRCWKSLARFDRQIDHCSKLNQLPDSAVGAIAALIETVPDEARELLFERHLLQLPGWAAFIKWRESNRSYAWQVKNPIRLEDLLAVRFALADAFGEELPEIRQAAQSVGELLAEVETREAKYQAQLMESLRKSRPSRFQLGRPQSQWVFCIDTRSEVFRRHLERTGHHETFGFAGFFGIPMHFTPFGEDVGAASCPVLLRPQVSVTEVPRCGHLNDAERYLHGHKFLRHLQVALKKMKADLGSAFFTVESTGITFGSLLALKTFAPKLTRQLRRSARSWIAPPVSLEISKDKDPTNRMGLRLEEQVLCAETALNLMGLRQFAPIVVFCAHGSQTENNPYAASLDCGACGGHPGGPNARLMAQICNDPTVRCRLAERGIVIPPDTVFVAAQHNTTTDEVEFLSEFPSGTDQGNHLKIDLKLATLGAREERSRYLTGTSSPNLRATNWAEVRPEWGLARNASFIVAHRSLTRGLDLEGRSFLHSYEWNHDANGKSLETILTAPMVVAQWINAQYFFSSLNPKIFGSGSKTTQNIVGKFGVMQGNGSDLKAGLPLQSVMRTRTEPFHEPLRLTTVVHAPVEVVAGVIDRNDILQKLFGNGWVHLIVFDPITQLTLRYVRGPDYHLGRFESIDVGTSSLPSGSSTHGLLHHPSLGH